MALRTLATLCAARLSMTTMLSSASAGASSCSHPATNASPTRGRSRNMGAIKPLAVNPSTKVTAFQCPCGIAARQRSPVFAHPRRRAILVDRSLSSMKIRRRGGGKLRSPSRLPLNPAEAESAFDAPGHPSDPCFREPGLEPVAKCVPQHAQNIERRTQQRPAGELRRRNRRQNIESLGCPRHGFDEHFAREGGDQHALT